VAPGCVAFASAAPASGDGALQATLPVALAAAAAHRRRSTQSDERDELMRPLGVVGRP